MAINIIACQAKADIFQLHLALRYIGVRPAILDVEEVRVDAEALQKHVGIGCWRYNLGDDLYRPQANAQ